MLWKEISPYFAKDEIFSPGTIMFPHLVDVDSLVKLNNFRERLNKPLICNTSGHRRRGVRSPSEQVFLSKEGLAGLTSMHVSGKAFDISCPSLSPIELEQAAKDFGWTFVKRYPSWIHVDNRDIVR